jgi:hypothetical protein
VRQLDPFEGSESSLELAMEPRPVPAQPTAMKPRRALPFAPHAIVEMGLEAFFTGRGFRVVQQYESTEVLTGIQLANSYFVESFTGGGTLRVEEHDDGAATVLMRNFLGGFRTAKLDVRGGGGQVLLTLELRRRPWPFNELTVYAWDGAELGRIVERFAWLGRRYELCDPSGSVLATLDKPFYRIWRFGLSRDGREIGQLVKQWGGFGRELYSQADAFVVNIEESLVDVRTRLLLVAASVLVDMVHFEKPRSGGFLGHRLAR